MRYLFICHTCAYISCTCTCVPRDITNFVYNCNCTSNIFLHEKKGDNSSNGSGGNSQRWASRAIKLRGTDFRCFTFAIPPFNFGGGCFSATVRGGVSFNDHFFPVTRNFNEVFISVDISAFSSTFCFFDRRSYFLLAHALVRLAEYNRWSGGKSKTTERERQKKC